MHSKIIIRVRGGLGNQLFIYAFAKYLSISLPNIVFLETRTGFIKDQYKRKYRLNKFNIQLKKCSIFHSLFYPMRNRFPTITNILYRDSAFLDETEFSKNPLDSLSKIQRSRITFLDGYWQNPHSFEPYKDDIREDLSMKIKLNSLNLQTADEMQKCTSVAVHFRRIEYKTLLGLDYYQNSINRLKDQLVDPKFYVFSDDINWCRKNFMVDSLAHYVDHNMDDEIAELWLMSQCKHFIIANSTFSWWGAWLSSYSGKIIIIPEKFE
jgi:hypothetical protein